MKTKQLFPEFGPVDYPQWERQVRKDLGVDDIRGLTTIHLSNGIHQEAYRDFTTQETSSLPAAYETQMVSPNTLSEGMRHWSLVETVKVDDEEQSNSRILEALNGGADGLQIEAEAALNWVRVFDQVLLSHCLVAIKSPWPVALDFITWLKTTGQSFQGYVCLEAPENQADELGQLLELTSDPAVFKTAVLYHQGTETGTSREIALLLSKAIHIINLLLESGKPLDRIIHALQFNITLSDRYLWEICRLRCLRILFHQIVRQYGLLDVPPSDLSIHAFTGMTTSRDQDTNHHMIRNTTQSMAAILGGCNLLTISPQPGLEKVAKQQRRTARNVSHLLKEEGQLHRVLDPAAGSYYLRSLLEKMLRQVWSQLQETERSGGYTGYLMKSETP